MKHEFIGSLIAITVIAIAGFFSYNNIQEKRLASLEKSLETASSRGINPIAVRCAYADSADNICVVYAAKTVVSSKE